jgi:hypothetical protein
MVNKSKLALITAPSPRRQSLPAHVCNGPNAPSGVRLDHAPGLFRDVDILGAKLPFRFVPETATR